MNKLEKARLVIDEIDTEIIKLFEKRMEEASGTGEDRSGQP